MKQRSMELKVGALVLFCIGLLVAFVLLLGDLGGATGHLVHVDYATASSLKPGAAVKIAGVTAGRISTISYWGGKRDEAVGRNVVVRVTLDLDPEMGRTLHRGARFYVSTLGVLGEKYIEVDPGDFDEPLLVSGAKVAGEPPLRFEVVSMQLARVAEIVARLLEDNEQIVRDLLRHSDETVVAARAAVDEAGALVKDNRATVREVIARLDDTGVKIDRVVDALQIAVGDGRVVRRSIAHVEAFSDRLDEGSRPVIRDARQIARNLEELSGRLRDEPTAEVVFGKEGQAKVLGVLDKVDGVVTDARAVTDNARQGRGTVGGILMDNELFMDIKLLLKDLKRHPWKFIWRE